MAVVIESLLGLIPQWLLEVVQRAPSKQMSRLQNHMKVSREVAQALLDRQMASHAENETGGSKDVMSILSTFYFLVVLFVSRHVLAGVSVSANISEDAEAKLDDEEILSQLT